MLCPIKTLAIMVHHRFCLFIFYMFSFFFLIQNCLSPRLLFNLKLWVKEEIDSCHESECNRLSWDFNLVQLITPSTDIRTSSNQPLPMRIHKNIHPKYSLYFTHSDLMNFTLQNSTHLLQTFHSFSTTEQKSSIA